MNGWRDRVVSGAREVAPRMVIYGVPGVGKSTFAASMPDPIVLDFDGGCEQLGCPRIPAPSTWTETLELITSLVDAQEYKTIVIDTIDPMETVATRLVCEQGKKSGLADFAWGGGYDALAQEWRVALASLERARARGASVCLLAHSVVRTAQDPTLGPFDQFTPQLQKKTWSATHRWADVVGFATFDSAKVGDERRAIVTGERVLLTTRGTGYEAKNRYGLPTRLPLSWAALANAMRSESADVVRARIVELARGTEHEAKAAGFIADAGADASRLRAIEDALKERLVSP